MIRGSTGRFLTLILAPLFVIGATALVLLPGRGDDKVTVDADGPVVHIEAPASGSRYSPGPLTVVSKVTDPDGLSTAELRVEGKRVARVTLSGSSEETTQFTWTPTPGRRVRALGSGTGPQRRVGRGRRDHGADRDRRRRAPAAAHLRLHDHGRRDRPGHGAAAGRHRGGAAGTGRRPRYDLTRGHAAAAADLTAAHGAVLPPAPRPPRGLPRPVPRGPRPRPAPRPPRRRGRRPSLSPRRRPRRRPRRCRPAWCRGPRSPHPATVPRACPRRPSSSPGSSRPPAR